MDEGVVTEGAELAKERSSTAGQSGQSASAGSVGELDQPARLVPWMHHTSLAAGSWPAGLLTTLAGSLAGPLAACWPRARVRACLPCIHHRVHCTPA